MNTFPRILVVLFNVLSYLHGYVLTYVEIFIYIIVVFIKLIFSRKPYFLLLEVSIFFFPLGAIPKYSTMGCNAF